MDSGMEDPYTLRATFVDGTCHTVSPEDIPTFIGRTDGLLWVHMEANAHEASAQYLEETFGFHPLEVEDALSDQERPTARADDESIFLVAPCAVLGGPCERYVEVAFFVSSHCVVTVCGEPVPSVLHWFELCETKPHASGGGAAGLLHNLLDTIVDAYFPTADVIADEIDALEEAIYEGGKVDVADALMLKRRLLEMRRQATPLRDVLNTLLRRDVRFLDARVLAYFQDVYDHTLRIVEIIDMERDILASVIDAHLSIVSNNLNQVMRELTVFATILMSSALVAGIYGMNFKGMPELQWGFGYPFAWVLMIGIGILEWWYFRRKGWI
jgi:magnesium transporter